MDKTHVLLESKVKSVIAKLKVTGVRIEIVESEQPHIQKVWEKVCELSA